jgi:hypothetical protein
MVKSYKFKNEEDKRDTIIEALRQLSDNLGWQVLKKVLEENIKTTEGKLHGEIEWNKDDTLEGLQRERNDRVRLLELPEDLINEYSEIPSWPIELDPYE